jgi:hypothetical protein
MTVTDYQRGIALVHQRSTAAIRALGDALRERQHEIDVDPSEPEPSEVRLGLASRQWRLLSYIATDPLLWNQERAAFVLRAIVDTHIVAMWLLAKDEFEMYRRFVEFGRGRLKLYKLHLEDAVEADGSLKEMEDFLEQLDSRVNEEILEEFQPINIGGNFAGISPRQMADETGLKRLFDLMYQPLSAEAHAEWDSLADHDLASSPDPLLHGHRFGLFHTRAERTHPATLGEAFIVATDTLREIFASLGLDISKEIGQCAETLTAALREGRELIDRGSSSGREGE